MQITQKMYFFDNLDLYFMEKFPKATIEYF